ncbi:hypothetical protein HOD61_02030 [archaeon]|jgi:hypothetical protein|nr:hypothetical protein [archaeon]
MVSTLQQSIEFMKDFGMFDVVLPFLLVFAIIFAILEKTFILGKETDGAPKKNLNSIVAFVIAMLAVATNKVVSALNEALPNVVLLIIVSVSFLMMIGVFLKTGELDLLDKHKGWYTLFTIMMFVGLLAIFASAIKFEGVSALSLLLSKLGSFTEPIAGIFIFLVVMGGVLYFITKGGKVNG